MKRPDPKLIEQQKNLRIALASAEEAQAKAAAVTKSARKVLNEMIEKLGDLILSEKRWNEWEVEKARIALLPPLSEEELAQFRAEHEANMQKGVRMGWWESVENGNPIPFSVTLKRSDFQENATMAHILVHIGAFPSVTQAIKNGRNTPITLGEHRIKRAGGGIHRIIIEE